MSAGSDSERAAIAVVGLAGRFPGAPDVERLWQSLCAGVESIVPIAAGDLEPASSPYAASDAGELVRVAAALDAVETFDAELFRFTPHEAAMTDPQQRLFLECAWEALEHAGYDPRRFAGAIGVWAGASLNGYLLRCLADAALVAACGHQAIALANDPATLATRVSYKLDLRGPSLAVHATCASSLLAVHAACQALLDGECDLALAGGVSIRLPQRSGYRFHEGGILSPDGHCRAFDADARGTVFGSGAGVVVLQRLDEARAEGAHVHAVIRGSAINNDGARKVGFTAPSVQGQADVIAEALANADVAAASLGYVEAHGTGTAVGDPIEVEALTRAFGARGGGPGGCALGSLKSNIGHLDAAAGIAGLIKSVLVVERGHIPPSLHFRTPNPRIDFGRGPFRVATALEAWRGPSPRRAGVSSFGIGGTNAHVVLEEAPPPPPSSAARAWQVLPIAANDAAALAQATRNLVAHLGARPDHALADVAFTLQVGRQALAHRRVLVARSHDEAIAVAGDAARLVAGVADEVRPVFILSGQGTGCRGSATALYGNEPCFRDVLDRGLALLAPALGARVRELLLATADTPADISSDILSNTLPDIYPDTSIEQPALFLLEYALAMLWRSWGITPAALLGHSLGEYVAACLAGVLAFDDALALVCRRAELMQATEPGVLLSVPLPEARLRGLVGARSRVAAVNGASLCVVSGPEDEIADFERRQGARGVVCRRLPGTRAFHSPAMEPAVAGLRAELRRLRLAAPRLPFISCVTGTWIREAEATDPDYWARQMCSTVRFHDGLATVTRDRHARCVDLGPEAARAPERLMGQLAQLWASGADVAWEALHAGERRRRLALPTYPFQRTRHWVEAPRAALPAPDAEPAKTPNADDWFYTRSWTRSLPLSTLAAREANAASMRHLLFLDDDGVGQRLAARLTAASHPVIGVRPGTAFERLDAATFVLDPGSAAHYRLLLSALEHGGELPARVVHLWAVTLPDGDGDAQAELDRGFYSVLFLAQALEARARDATELVVVTSGALGVTGDEPLRPLASTVIGPLKVAPQECPQLACAHVDLPPGAAAARDQLGDALYGELFGERCPTVAYRAGYRWREALEPLPVAALASPRSALRPGGVYVIFGGLGRFGLILAEWLARAWRARLVLTSLSALPPRERWASLLEHGTDERAAARVRKLHALYAAGAEVTPAAPLDLADARAVGSLLDETEARWGRIDGVIHAAGITGAATHRALQEADRAHAEEIFGAKVRGLLVLERALRHRDVDFCLLTSSLSPFLGGLGLAAYAGASQFLDVFAQAARSPTRWMSINWEGWHGLAEPLPAHALGSTLSRLAMTDAEVIDCCERLLRVDGLTHAIVATADLAQRRRLWSASDRRPLAAAPTTDIEAGVLAVVRASLGDERVGAADNFFDRGVNSLGAVRLLARLRDRFQRRIPLRALFDHPTAARLAAFIRGDAPAGDDAGLVEALLREVESLTPDEARARLEAEQGRAAPAARPRGDEGSGR